MTKQEYEDYKAQGVDDGNGEGTMKLWKEDGRLIQ